MSRFKRCEMGNCTGRINKIHPHVITFRSTDEGFGHVHGKQTHGICQHCGGPKHVMAKTKKMKICNHCYDDLKLGVIQTIETNKVERQVESFDETKNILFYSLYQQPLHEKAREQSQYDTYEKPRIQNS